MKISEVIKKKLNKMAVNSSENRKLSSEVLIYLENKGIDIHKEDFNSAWSYIEGDCDETILINYIENLERDIND